MTDKMYKKLKNIMNLMVDFTKNAIVGLALITQIQTLEELTLYVKRTMYKFCY